MLIIAATRSRGIFFDNFTRDADKHRKILHNYTIHHEVKRMLNNDVPYSPPAGLLEPKALPMEEFHGDYCFMYKEECAFVQGDLWEPSFIAGPRFEAYLRSLAEEIIDVAVRNVIDELDRIIFEEEESVILE